VVASSKATLRLIPLPGFSFTSSIDCALFP
jgi:hypothetical protein